MKHLSISKTQRPPREFKTPEAWRKYIAIWSIRIRRLNVMNEPVV